MNPKKYTNKELAESHVFPSELSPIEQKKANEEFSKRDFSTSEVGYMFGVIINPKDYV
jgi:hypothetical protein